MTTHELKIHPKYFSAVATGIKTFEVRKKDRDYKVGDVLLLKEFDPVTNKYTGGYVGREVTYILEEQPFVPEGYVIMAIEPA